MRFPASGALLIRLALLLWGAAPAIAAYCTTDQIRQIRASVGHFGRATRCPDATWKEAFFAGPTLQNASRPIVVYDIGCNKAFDALATWQSLTRRAIDFERWHEPYKGTPYSCGACDQCHGRPPPTQGTPKRVRLFCVEPLPPTFRIIYAGTARLGLQAEGLAVLNGAFTSRADAEHRGWSARFPVGDAFRGDEAFGIASAQEKGFDTEVMVPVPLYVLDDHVRQEAVPYVDVLSIDTEGNDPLVLQGARRTLADKVRYVEFEYHRVGAWATTKLSSVIQDLDELGFVCYWIGVGKLWRITGCFHPSYDVPQWSNIGCVKASHVEWYEVMERIFKRTVPGLYANYWAPLTRKRHTMPHSAQPQHTNYWAPRTRKLHQQEHRPQRPTESSNPTQHAKGRTGPGLSRAP